MKLRDPLREPPPDGGLWSSRKVANWMAGELSLVSVAPQRGWEAHATGHLFSKVVEPASARQR